MILISSSPFFRRSALLALIALGSGAGIATARPWTDLQGRQIQGELLSVTGDRIALRLDSGGKTVNIALDRLSAADRAYVETWSKENPARSVDPAAKPAAGPAAPEIAGFGAPWPESVRLTEDPEIAAPAEGKAEQKPFIYESRNYRFISDVPLAKSVVKSFSIVFETTQLYCRMLPLEMSGGARKDGKYQILLYETEEDYFAAGGPRGSAGVFDSGKQAVLVPLQGLGVRKVGSGYMLDRDKTNHTVIHELTHQLTPTPYFLPGAMGWFTEGIAEYVATTPYRSGVFRVKSNLDEIIGYITETGKDNKGGRALGREISVPALKEFMMMPYQRFTAVNGQLNYGFSLMLVTYFFHFDGNGDGARIKEFLAALKAGKSHQQALDVLLGGRSYHEVEAEIAKAWKRRNIAITFAAETGSGNE